jgi:hypothetical protein
MDGLPGPHLIRGIVIAVGTILAGLYAWRYCW